MLHCGDQLWMSTENFDMLNLLERLKRRNTKREESKRQIKKERHGWTHFKHNITTLLKTSGSTSLDFATAAYT